MLDANQQVLAEGDNVLVSIGLLQHGLGQIVKVNSGLATPENPTGLSSVVLAIQFTLTIPPGGAVPGVTKLGAPVPMAVAGSVTL